MGGARAGSGEEDCGQGVMALWRWAWGLPVRRGVENLMALHEACRATPAARRGTTMLMELRRESESPYRGAVWHSPATGGRRRKSMVTTELPGQPLAVQVQALVTQL